MTAFWYINSTEKYLKWIGYLAAMAIVLGGILIYTLVHQSSYQSAQPMTQSIQFAENPVSNSTPVPQEDTWRCKDATSYNQNALDDNACTKGGETKYVSDSESRQLDPSYTPGQSGAAYYNNQ